jgi:undecaprenyl-diphosphatase
MMSDRNLFLLLLCLLLLWGCALALGGPTQPLDRLILNAMHRPALADAARIVTMFGNWPATTIVALAAAAWLAVSRQPRKAVLLLVINSCGRGLVELQKLGFARARPDAEGHLVAVHSLSFPSGHAANSMLIWLSIALLAATPRLRLPAVMLAVLLSLLTGLTRLVLDVHWPTDLIGGWSFGAAWTLLLVRFAAPDQLLTGRSDDARERRSAA